MKRPVGSDGKILVTGKMDAALFEIISPALQREYGVNLFLTSGVRHPEASAAADAQADKKISSGVSDT